MNAQRVYNLLIRSALLTAGMLCVWISLDTLLSGSVWAGMTISKSALTVEYCEFNHVDRFFHQPMNTYSNLAYFFFGVFIVQVAWYDYTNRAAMNQNRLEKFPLLSALVGVCFVYLSVGSAFFHASLTYTGQRVDMNGTYGITLVLVSVALYHVFYTITFTRSMQRGWVLILVVLIGLFFKIALLIPSSVLLPALILGLITGITINYVQFRKERSVLVAIASVICIVVAVKIRTMDVQKIGCDPFSPIQGHSVWHLLTAISSFCSYSFFRFTRVAT